MLRDLSVRAISRLRGGAATRVCGLALVALVLVGMHGAATAAGARRVMGLYPTPVAGAPAGAALPMVDSQIELVVRGPVVEAVVTQRFTNPTARPIEATYIFPLPADAAVSALAITTGARTIHAAIARRDESQRRYEDAVRAGVAAVVLDQERPDVFTQTIAAIPAGGSVVVRLRFDTVARFGDGTWALVLPLVVAPRYVPGTASGRATTGVGRAPDTDRAPDASRITPGASPRGGGATAVRLAFVDAVTDLTSPTHELVVHGPRAASLVDPRSDHDMVIRWRASAPAGGWLEVGADGGGIAAVVVEAPAAAPRTGALRVVLVLDRAATMTGDAQIAAQPLVRGLFAALGPADRVALAGDPAQGFGPPADGLATVERAWTRAGGPFDLTRVLTAARPAGAPLVLVSDGLVADDDAALAAARALRVPVHVIGVGPAPNRGLLTRLAATTGGTARFVLPGDDLAAIARATLADVAGPAAPLTVSWGTLSAREVVPALLPRLGAGQAMLVLARVGRAQRANARARGELIALQELPRAAALDGAITPAGPLARRWARLHLEDLLAGRRDAAAITAHALAYGLVSPYTSLVAIGTETIVEGGVKHSLAVPVAVPAGMDWSTVEREITVDTTTTTSDLGGGEQRRPEVASAGKATEDARRAQRPPAAKKQAYADPPRPVTRPRPTTPARPVVRRPVEAAPPQAPAPAASIHEPVLDRVTSGAVSVDQGAAGAAMDDADLEADEAAEASPRAEATGTAESTALVMSERSPSGGARFAVVLGGGLVLGDDVAALITLAGRVERSVGARGWLGVEGSLWLVGGSDLQGLVLGRYARTVPGRLEFEVGAGLHAGAGTGPAAALEVARVLGRLGGGWLALALRWDAAYLGRDDAWALQHGLSAALRVRW